MSIASDKLTEHEAASLVIKREERREIGRASCRERV